MDGCENGCLVEKNYGNTNGKVNSVKKAEVY